jgi:hypothetical protein
MNLTNRLRLPEPIVRAIANDSYTKGDADISVTELLGPPQIRHLKKLHVDEIVEDAADRIWSLLGQAVHAIIERSGTAPTELNEVTLNTEYLGWKIKGTFDHVTLVSGELNDYKVTTVWKLAGDKVPEDWIAQTNIYRRILAKEKGVQIGSIAVIAILRDWSKNEAARRQDYPQAQAVRVEIPLWSDEETDDFIRERLMLHQEELPSPCTDSDIWAKPGKFAVVKKGQVRAVKLFDASDEAQALANTIAGSRVEARPAVATRCLSYCPVSQWCPQWAADPRRPSPSIVEDFFNNG